MKINIMELQPNSLTGTGNELARSRCAQAKALEEAGARVDVVPAYQTVVPENFDRGQLRVHSA